MSYPIQDIFTRFYPDFLKVYQPTFEQNKVANDIIKCKTPAMGGNASFCEDCESVVVHYNSCRDRHCPCCQGLAKEKWIDKRKSEVVDAPYFHAIFTVPEETNPLIYANKKLLYNLMYQASADTLKALAADKKYLNASIGFMSILHTHGQNLSFHPHLHCIVLGGGLTKDLKFNCAKEDFLFPIFVVAKLFRNKYLDALKALFKAGELSFGGSSLRYRNSYEFKELLNILYRKNWVPHIKETFKGAQGVIEYLGRYTHRVAISNARILSVSEEAVRFRAKDYKNGGKSIIITLSPVEFIRRFLMHVLPRKFVKIRHYGILSNRVKKVKLAICRNIVRGRYQKPILDGMSTTEILKELFGININQCPFCKGNHLKPYHRRE